VDGKELAMSQGVNIPRRISRHWDIDPSRVFQSRYKYNGQRIFKFAYQPETRVLIFDTTGVHHDTMILNNKQGKFEDYVRGICFWTKRVIYLRGHENENWLKVTKAMLRKSGVPANYRVVWGGDAATELETELRGL
jgi:hypothetical protein